MGRKPRLPHSFIDYMKNEAHAGEGVFKRHKEVLPPSPHDCWFPKRHTLLSVPSLDDRFTTEELAELVT